MVAKARAERELQSKLVKGDTKAHRPRNRRVIRHDNFKPVDWHSALRELSQRNTDVGQVKK